MLGCVFKGRFWHADHHHESAHPVGCALSALTGCSVRFFRLRSGIGTQPPRSGGAGPAAAGKVPTAQLSLRELRETAEKVHATVKTITAAIDGAAHRRRREVSTRTRKDTHEP